MTKPKLKGLKTMNTVLKISTNEVMNKNDYEIKINGQLDSGESMTYAYAKILLDLGDEYDFNHELTIYSSIQVDEEGLKEDLTEDFNDGSLTIEEIIRSHTYNVWTYYELSPIIKQYELSIKMEQFINDMREALDRCLLDGIEYEYNCKIEQGRL